MDSVQVLHVVSMYYEENRATLVLVAIESMHLCKNVLHARTRINMHI